MMLSEFWQLLWGIWLPFAPNFSGILNLDPDIPHHSVLKFEIFVLSKKKKKDLLLQSTSYCHLWAIIR